MAEIRVERKQGAGKWLWILLLVIVLIALAVYLWYSGYINLGAAEAVTTEDAWHVIMNV
jgi:drug/metabolite transporter (DMT)-like permease